MVQRASDATTPAENELAAVEFQLTPEDWEDANLAHLRASRLQRQAIGRTRTAFAVLFAALAAMTLLIGEPLAALMLGFAGVGMTALARPLHEHNLRRAVRKLGEDGLANGTFGPHTVSVTPQGLVNSTPSYEWLVRWSAVEEVRLQDGMFLIYIGPNAFMVVPESAFPDAATTRAFADAFYRHVAGPSAGSGAGLSRPEQRDDSGGSVNDSAEADSARVAIDERTGAGTRVAGARSAPDDG